MKEKEIIKSNYSGVTLILQERENQLARYKVIDDLMNNENGELIMAAISLLLESQALFPNKNHWVGNSLYSKILSKPYHIRLAKVGALIAAEIDRFKLEISEGESERLSTPKSKPMGVEDDVKPYPYG